jgi:glycosyltransferase involved in cell wall biosynthesis
MMSVDIFCLTSLWEGFGYVLVEAMACNKPIVAFDISSNPEIIDNGQTGFLVPVSDVEGLVEKTVALMKDKNLCESFGAKGRLRVEQIFDIEKTTGLVRELLSIF